jgi:Na+-transporting NADH:ubiquinone oxidoreductase subunit A
MLVEVGDRVRLGQPLFADRKRPEIVFTSPGSGMVAEINRGERRALRSVVVRLEGQEEERFAAYPRPELARLTRDRVAENLLASGLWTALRTRPYGKVPDPGSEPHAVFITAMDSNPLATDPAVVIAAHGQDFADGLDLLSRLTAGRVYLCKAAGAEMPEDVGHRITVAEFAGPHPAGLPGTHIHLLDPASAEKTVWHLGYQDVIAIGKLFATGRIWTERTLALAGPLVRRPRLIRARLGACTDDLARGETEDVERRVISGSILSGHTAAGPEAFLGRYHTQISVIAEGRAGRGAHTATGLFASLLARGKDRALTTALNGRPTAMLPVGAYERVIPLDILPVPLLRALLVGDTDMARGLGCLELEEEDLALCTFVCPGKSEYGPLLRSCLERIEKEG